MATLHYRGFKVEFGLGGYFCPALKLYSYPNRVEIERAIDVELSKR